VIGVHAAEPFVAADRLPASCQISRRRGPPQNNTLGCTKNRSEEAVVRFDIYGRYQLEIIREDDSWKIYSLGVGTRAPVESLIIPPDTQPHELEIWLDDLLHELAEPGRTIRRVG
jgi:hypothetical protein